METSSLKYSGAIFADITNIFNAKFADITNIFTVPLNIVISSYILHYPDPSSGNICIIHSFDPQVISCWQGNDGWTGQNVMPSITIAVSSCRSVRWELAKSTFSKQTKKASFLWDTEIQKTEARCVYEFRMVVCVQKLHLATHEASITIFFFLKSPSMWHRSEGILTANEQARFSGKLARTQRKWTGKKKKWE